MEKETVTLSLEHYEEMKNELERLRKENQEKTIYKYSEHWKVRLSLVVILFFGLLVLLIKQ